MENSSNLIQQPVPAFIPGSLQKVTIRMVMAILIFILNIFTALTFGSMKKKTFSNVLYFSSSLSDMMIGLFHIPLAIIPNLYTFYPLGSGMCYLTTFISGYNFQVTTDTLVILTIHRFLLVVRPVAQTEKLSWNKIILVLVPWVFRLATGLTNIFVNVSQNRYNYAVCVIFFERTYLLIEHIVIVLMPWITEVLFILLTMAVLAYKRKNSIAAKSDIPAIPKSNQNHTKANSSTTRQDHENHSRSGTNDSRHARSGNHAIRQNKCNQMMSRLLKGFNKNSKALVCLSALILNMTIFELPFLLALPYSLICCCIFDVIYILDTLAYCFPLFNPIIIFIFHDSFRVQFFVLMKKITN